MPEGSQRLAVVNGTPSPSATSLSGHRKDWGDAVDYWGAPSRPRGDLRVTRSYRDRYGNRRSGPVDDKSGDVNCLRAQMRRVPYATMGPFLARGISAFGVPWLKARAAARLTTAV